MILNFCKHKKSISLQHFASKRVHFTHKKYATFWFCKWQLLLAPKAQLYTLKCFRVCVCVCALVALRSTAPWDRCFYFNLVLDPFFGLCFPSPSTPSSNATGSLQFPKLLLVLFARNVSLRVPCLAIRAPRAWFYAPNHSMPYYGSKGLDRMFLWKVSKMFTKRLSPHHLSG